MQKPEPPPEEKKAEPMEGVENGEEAAVKAECNGELKSKMTVNEKQEEEGEEVEVEEFFVKYRNL
jgi:hypothetical protein